MISTKNAALLIIRIYIILILREENIIYVLYMSVRRLGYNG
jgi:hypothetical protein